MHPARKLLYHRGIDDSPGTYITDYVLFAFCALLTCYLAWVIIKYIRSGCEKSAVTKSTYAVVIIIGVVGLAALIGGLAHQFLQQVEPYNTWTDNMTWLIIWRMAASTSAVASFAFFMLAEQLLSAEEIWHLNKTQKIIYYVIAFLICIGIGGYSVAQIFAKGNPWSVTITLAIVFVCTCFEMVVALIVVCKRFTLMPDGSETPCTDITSDDIASSNCFPEDGKKKLEVYTQKSFLEKNNNNDLERTKRWDLLLHFLAPFVFIIGGVTQLLLGSVAQCGKHRVALDPCPLPEEFNHNSILHVIHIIAIGLFFAAEIFSIRYRRQQYIRNLFKRTGYV